MKNSTILILFGLIISACATKNDPTIETIIDEYYQVYSKRQDINSFLGFYDENILLEDIINGDRIEGKNNLKKFVDWNNPDFKVLDSNSLIINEKIIGKNQAVVKGYFTKFQWGNMVFEPMHFTTILTFNESKKIIRQVDWINYPSNLVDYQTRKNSNTWIK